MFAANSFLICVANLCRHCSIADSDCFALAVILGCFERPDLPDRTNEVAAETVSSSDMDGSLVATLSSADRKVSVAFRTDGNVDESVRFYSPSPDF